MSLIIELLGTRGSLATPYPPQLVEERFRNLLNTFIGSRFRSANDVDGFMESLPQHIKGGYGGDTTCVSVRSGLTELFVDGGTGLRHPVPRLMQGDLGHGKGEAHILMTHFHWDHLMGLPFFAPIYVPGNKVHFYGVQDELAPVIKMLFTKPMFPVPFESIADNVVFHKVEPRKPFKVGELTVAAYKLDHPDPCWGYRIEAGGKAYAHCVDTEGTRVSREELGPDLPLYQNADLMYFDAQYTVDEHKEKINWGHGTIVIGMELALRERIKHIVFGHHDPSSTDDRIAKKAHEAVKLFEDRIHREGLPHGLADIKWSLGIEGTVIRL